MKLIERMSQAPRFVRCTITITMDMRHLMSVIHTYEEIFSFLRLEYTPFHKLYSRLTSNTFAYTCRVH